MTTNVLELNMTTKPANFTQPSLPNLQPRKENSINSRVGIEKNSKIVKAFLGKNLAAFYFLLYRRKTQKKHTTLLCMRACILTYIATYMYTHIQTLCNIPERVGGWEPICLYMWPRMK